MDDDTGLFSLHLNLGLVLKGQVQDLEELLAEIQRFVGSKHGMRLVFRELSGDQLRIVRRQGP